VLLAGGLSLGFEAKALGHALGLASGAGILAVTAVWADRDLEPRRAWVAGVAPWMVLSSVCFAYWSTSGLETPLFTLFVTGALAAYAARRLGLATAAAFLATVTRPDGVLVAAAIFAWHVLSHFREERWRGLLWPAVFAALLVALTGWRLAYYGSPVPNTFFAKVGGVPAGRGWQYALGFYAGGVWLLAVPFALAAADRRWQPAAVYVALVTSSVVAVGGDAFPYARFFLPVLPALAVLAVRGADRATQRDLFGGGLLWACIAGFVVWNLAGRYTWGVAACVLAAACIWTIVESLRRRTVAWKPAAAAAFAALVFAADVLPDPAQQVGGLPGRRTRAESLASIRARNAGFERLALNRLTTLEKRDHLDRWVAAGAIGAFGFYTNAPIIDLFGLVNPVIARSQAEKVGRWTPPGHQRSNADYVLARRPQYILIPRKDAKRATPPVPSSVEIWRHPDFISSYSWDPAIVGYQRTADP
jgi:hypothetical protein